MSLGVLLDSLPRCRAIVSVVAVGRDEMSKDEDSKARDELHDGETMLDHDGGSGVSERRSAEHTAVIGVLLGEKVADGRDVGSRAGHN